MQRRHVFRRLVFPFSTLVFLFFFYQTATNERLAPRFACIRDYGPLIIHSGSTVSLEAGKVYQYSNILIHKGGLLQIVGRYPEWTTIRTSGDLRIEGKIKAVANTLVPELKGKRFDSIAMTANGTRCLYEIKGVFPEIEIDTVKNEPAFLFDKDSMVSDLNAPRYAGAEFNITMTDSVNLTGRLKRKTLSFPIGLADIDTVNLKLTLHAKALRAYESVKNPNEKGEQNLLKHQYGPDQKGGQGGHGGRPNECKPGSRIQVGLFDGKKGTNGKGAKGHVGMSALVRHICESAIAKCFNDGDESCVKAEHCHEETGNCHGDTYMNGKTVDLEDIRPGKGGLGGAIGTHGGLLFFDVAGDLLGEYGIVDVSGNKGKKGANGESEKYTGGGGGGGGPGGNGGKAVFRVYGAMDSPKILTGGGLGGDGGKGGVPHAKDGLPTMTGGDGKKGNKGSDGEKDLGDYIVSANNFNLFYFQYSFQKMVGWDSKVCEDLPLENNTIVK